MPEPSQFSGITPDQIAQAGKVTKQEPPVEPKNELPVEPKNELQEDPKTGNQGPSVDEKDINTLKNTFGVDFEQVPESLRDGVLKMAKSYREAQGKFTRELEQRQLFEQTLTNFEATLKSYPEVWDTVEKIARGEYTQQTTGNSKQEPKGQPKIPSQPAIVDEQTLIQEGYLTESQLDGLDELAKARLVAKAEIAYYKDQQLKQLEQQTRETLEKVEEDRKRKDREAYINTTNTQRFNESFDRFVSEYGVDFTALDEDTINAIRRRTNGIRDMDDPSLIDPDAFYDAAVKELSIRGKLPERKPIQPSNGVNQILDTGFSANRRPASPKSNGPQDKMDQIIADRWRAINNINNKNKKLNIA